MDRRRSYSPRNQVDVAGTTVVKASDDRPDLEFAKAAALARLAREHGFVAPAPTGYDAGAGTVTYERIEVGVALGALIPVGPVPPSPEVVAAFARAGAALGTIHSGLRIDRPTAPVPSLPPAVARFLPDATIRHLLADGAEAPVVGHGDYSIWNVFDRGTGRGATAVVLDCCPNLYTSFAAVTRETRYLDLGLFDSCLLGRASLPDHLRTRSRHLGTLRRAFLDGYREASGIDIDPDHLRATSRAVLSAYLMHRRGWRPGSAAAAGRIISHRRWRQPR